MRTIHTNAHNSIGTIDKLSPCSSGDSLLSLKSTLHCACLYRVTTTIAHSVQTTDTTQTAPSTNVCVCISFVLSANNFHYSCAQYQKHSLCTLYLYFWSTKQNWMKCFVALFTFWWKSSKARWPCSVGEEGLGTMCSCVRDNQSCNKNQPGVCV